VEKRGQVIVPLIIEKWMFDLVKSSDMSVIMPIQEATSQNLSMFYNRSGSYGSVVPIDSNVSDRVAAWKTAIRATAEWYDEGHVLLGRKVMWSGPVIDVNDDASSEATTISALGWLEELEHRFLTQRMVYPSQAGGLIAMDLLSVANAKADIAGTTRPTRIKPGLRTDTQVRAMTYEVGQNIGAAIKGLSDIENGFDYEVGPIDRALNIKSPTEFSTRKKVQFGYKMAPNNIVAVSRQQDGKRANNRVIAAGPPGLAIQDDIDSIDELGIMLEGWYSLSDVTNIDILSAFAGSQLAFSSYPVSTITVKPMIPSKDVWLPRLGLHYDLGDIGFLSVNRGRMQLNAQPIRIFGQNYAFTQEGDPTVTSMDLAYSS
jgi:hypothetical protein